MSTDRIRFPTSHVALGMARREITPPVGIYHRMWGAARHDRATGVHCPLICDVIVITPLAAEQPRLVRAQLDLCGLVQSQHRRMVEALGGATGTSSGNVVIAYSHTHAGGWFAPDRFAFPGGELIPRYLDDLEALVCEAGAQAARSMQEVTIDYTSGSCRMAANRDYWDAQRGGYACGYNPDTHADETLVLGRISDADGRLLGTVVNYGCHPTTLAWENTLLSPDYPGKLREVVESATNRPCVFLLGACGDIGPRHGFVGDTEAADTNGRQVAYAALSSLAGMGPPSSEYRYAGAVVSGATLGIWQYHRQTAETQQCSVRVEGAACTVDLP